MFLDGCGRSSVQTQETHDPKNSKFSTSANHISASDEKDTVSALKILGIFYKSLVCHHEMYISLYKEMCPFEVLQL